MNKVYTGPGKLAGKGVYAAKDLAPDELVMNYDLKPINQAEFDALPEDEQMFVHSFWGKMYLFSEPSRYTNHSANPNTRPDFQKMCDYAVRPIKKGEMITTNATLENKFEVQSFIDNLETKSIGNFSWLKGGYRNAQVSYSVNGATKVVCLERKSGNWQIVE